MDANSINAVKGVAALLECPLLDVKLHVADVRVEPISARLTSPFPISSDISTHAHGVNNVLVRMNLSDGALGLGEAAPFFGISGDTQEMLLNDLHPVANDLIGKSLNVFELEQMARDECAFPAARAALEMAFLDGFARKLDRWMSTMINEHAVTERYVTDVTIPLLGVRESARLAIRYVEQGFHRIKIKVGGRVRDDLMRIEATREVFGQAGKRNQLEILLDANEGYSRDNALVLIGRAQSPQKDIKIFEQPVARHAFDDLAAVKERAHMFGVLVFADESVYTVEDAAALVERGAVDGFNLKLMKHGGFLEALRIADCAMQHGTKLMIGGMIETRLAMTASLHLARLIGSGQLAWLDLDTPLLVEDDHLFDGGIKYMGSSVQFPDKPIPGIGVNVVRHVSP